MRIDLFLKASRLCPRRSVAQALCESGAIEVNGAPSKSSRAVRPGDEVTLRRPRRILTVRVLYIPATKQVARHEAASLYEILSDTAPEQDHTI